MPQTETEIWDPHNWGIIAGSVPELVYIMKAQEEIDMDACYYAWAEIHYEIRQLMQKYRYNAHQ